MTVEPNAARGWPADVIHVNEDGWVLINRGRAGGVVLGMRLLVVGSGTRELRDLFASVPEGGTAPLALRLRRTYELLEVVYVEEQCAVAVAERAPAARRPRFYRGPSGELLVWVPLPDDYTWPPVSDDASDDADEGAGEDADSGVVEGRYRVEEGDADDDTPDSNDLSQDAASDTPDDTAPSATNTDGDDTRAASSDEPPGSRDQEDQRWEEALPLNSVSVGDIVVPAIPATPGSDTGSAASPDSRPEHAVSEPHYDWMDTTPKDTGS